MNISVQMPGSQDSQSIQRRRRVGAVSVRAGACRDDAAIDHPAGVHGLLYAAHGDQSRSHGQRSVGERDQSRQSRANGIARALAASSTCRRAGALARARSRSTHDGNGAPRWRSSHMTSVYERARRHNLAATPLPDIRPADDGQTPMTLRIQKIARPGRRGARRRGMLQAAGAADAARSGAGRAGNADCRTVDDRGQRRRRAVADGSDRGAGGRGGGHGDGQRRTGRSRGTDVVQARRAPVRGGTASGGGGPGDQAQAQSAHATPSVTRRSRKRHRHKPIGAEARRLAVSKRTKRRPTTRGSISTTRQSALRFQAARGDCSVVAAIP